MGDDDAGDGEEVEPVEVLVQLAEDGEIEPWDIDIVAVTDKFLDALDEVDLRVSARALFYASVLLRMKSDAMLEDEEEEEEEPAMEMGMGPGPDPDFPGVDPVDALEAEMDRRLDRKTARGTPETLDGLIRELRERERGSWWKRSRSYDTTDGFGGPQTVDYRADDAARGEYEPTEEEVTGTAHGEDIEATIEAVEAALVERYSRGRPEVLFREVADAGGSRVRTFLALLFLADRGVVALEQDELFGDLWIQDRSAVADTGEAVAD
ncbi:MAG: segregation/condensation protein A [Halobacteriaceae archaeon]